MPEKYVKTVEFTDLTPSEAARKLKELIDRGEPFRAVFRFSEVTWVGLEYDTRSRRWYAVAYRPRRRIGEGELVKLPLLRAPEFATGHGTYLREVSYMRLLIGADGKEVIVLMSEPGYVAFIWLPAG